MSALVWHLWEPRNSRKGCVLRVSAEKKYNYIFIRYLDPYESKNLNSNLFLSFPPNCSSRFHHKIVLFKLENVTFIVQNKTLVEVQNS